ncbi:MAG TPA: hypothetical protein PK493_00615 [Pseudomonadota bacterium]|nr:hypothetical protein [Pseudomonadota bacterium]
MRRFLGGALLALLAVGMGCQSSTKNPSQVWIDYYQSELNLVLTDHEPPPF